MSRPLRTLLVLCIAALVVAGLAVQPAMAKESKEACWKTLINDWYDGVIDDKYKLACYREAIDRLAHYPDLNNYSTAREDINRAYQARIAEIRKSRNQPKTPPKSNGPDENSQEIPVLPPPPPPPGGGDKGHVGTPTPTPPPVERTDPPGKVTTNENRANAVEKGPTVVRLPDRPASTQPGRQGPDGPIPSAIAKLGPDDADSLPIPLLVLGGLALVLILGGVLGFIARRMQSRRLPMTPATAPAKTSRR